MRQCRCSKLGIAAARSLLTLLLAAGAPLAASAEVRVAIGSLLTDGPNTSPRDAEVLESQLRAALAEAVTKAAEDGCEIVNLDLDRRLLEGRKTEQRLMDEGYAPKDGIKIGEIIVSDLINGIVGSNGDGGFDYVLEADNLVSGKVVARVEGDTSSAKMGEAAERIAQQFVEMLCKPKPYRLQAKYNDLEIDTLICDPAKPFQFNGRGASAGLTFSLTPEGEAGGKWTVAGQAAGVAWSGGGSYTQALGAETGTLDLGGSWRITTPMGVFSDSGTIMGKVARLATTQCAGD